ncbi:MAG: hypothetical protein V2A71_09705, partial [Candidatus Eisenbacteria bacterium]
MRRVTVISLVLLVAFLVEVVTVEAGTAPEPWATVPAGRVGEHQTFNEALGGETQDEYVTPINWKKLWKKVRKIFKRRVRKIARVCIVCHLFLPDGSGVCTRVPGAFVGSTSPEGWQTAQLDTFYYGGTLVVGGKPYADEPTAPGYANRKMWSFDAGGWNGTPHSGLPMDGWKGVDGLLQPEDFFRVMDDATLGGTPCAISGNKSLVCAATNAECEALCYVDGAGAGYGNNWVQNVVTGSYAYTVGNQITLSYDYRSETEPGYDSSYVMVQIQDAGEWVDHAVLAAYEGSVSGSANIDLDSHLPAVNCNFRIRFRVLSDEETSDEDGYSPTTCGAFALDNYALSGDIVDSENFEGVAVGARPSGWSRILEGCGDFAAVRHLDDLAPNLSIDACVSSVPQLCSMADSVITLYDESSPFFPHPLCQDNYVLSPRIDLSSRPGLSGKILYREVFSTGSLTDHVFTYWRARYAPACASGGWSPWLSDGCLYYGGGGASCVTECTDLSSRIPPHAEQLEIGLGVVNVCAWDPWDLGCSYICDPTPYYDNVTVGVFSTTDAPYISMREIDYWQDQFAEDGTLNSTSTADTRTPLCLGNLVPPVFGDTLVCSGSANDMEVYFVFRMTKVGPQQPVTDPFFTTWFPTATT